MSTTGIDQALYDDWHVIADIEGLQANSSRTTTLFEIELNIESNAQNDSFDVSISKTGQRIESKTRYGFLWACLGDPKQDIIEIMEAEEADRHVISGGSFGVHTSGLRVVENFLDMAHFPFVHTDYLGVEPHTEVPPYNVGSNESAEVMASECRFYQPVASPTAEGGIMADYEYMVYRPYTVALLKTNPVQPHRRDFIALFIQPVTEDRCVAHTFLCYLEDSMGAAEVRWFMQLIFSQDKPILENQVPKLLPLDPRAETPIRADAVSISYRDWLRRTGVRYGANPV
jgi:phenylpropionate dioxygenase-like ring-hydroxylating dioxygenase large terminal subunit